ncbi:MAG: hypothetical protein AB7U34_05885 [Novosphingobium sp.]
MDTLPELMTLADFRRRYSISNTQLYREVQAGRLRLRKMGAASRIARTDAEAWAASLPIREGAEQ